MTVVISVELSNIRDGLQCAFLKALLLRFHFHSSSRGLLTNHFLSCSQVPPWMKLPAFYLLDAISKNVYEPYSRHFASFVIPLFLEAYGQVDEVTRNKMEEMLFTWRTGSPTGKELFGVAPQIAIERGVWGDGSSRVTKAQVLSELEYTLGQKERALQSNPYDTLSQNHVNVLHQVSNELICFVRNNNSSLVAAVNRSRRFSGGTSADPRSTACSGAPSPVFHVNIALVCSNVACTNAVPDVFANCILPASIVNVLGSAIICEDVTSK